MTIPALPPKPDLPASVAAARFEDAVSEPGGGAEVAAEPDVDPEHERQPQPEPAAVAEPDLESEPEVMVDVQPDVDQETERKIGSESAPEPEPEIEPEPELTVEPAVEPALKPEPTVEPEHQPEIVPEREVEPGPEVTPEPEPAPEIEPEPEPAPEPEPEPDLGLEPDLALEPDPGLEPEPEPEGPAPATAVLPTTDRIEPTEGGTAFALRMSHVSKAFGRTLAVDAVDLEIPAGTFYGIVGPNGAGKTTTLSMIAGLLRPDSGTIQVGGVDLRRDPRGAKALMGVLPDRLRTFDRLTGRQLLHYYGVLRGLRPAVVTERTQDLARAFDLTAALARPVSDYSAGMTKKIMLAGAMIHAPRLLVLDEPFEAVDPVSSAVILDILSAYVARGGTVVLSSHGMELVERVCDGVAVIVAGQVLAQGTVDEVRGDKTLAERFVQLSGGLSDVEGLEWLHTYSD
ncbi:ABC transporter ATP-binding protein [Microbacterium oleivorans]|uniref:ABC transporter ATP-binding protein n=1 Tax=Microbacterium oleivorans TaxID=273677 RepID=UPI000A863614|nr:ABC transporter ATP-binding protein [Microbacterium oleivorans]